jgi:hypothetical protein
VSSKWVLVAEEDVIVKDALLLLWLFAVCWGGHWSIANVVRVAIGDGKAERC